MNKKFIKLGDADEMFQLRQQRERTGHSVPYMPLHEIFGIRRTAPPPKFKSIRDLAHRHRAD
jgi:hypothetical protein